ncbi:MAG: hypothetical protein NTW21_07785 [Verrucomicrobia bacterium]|nr:hypothetical protein [Verrucomicrobiota bacterium]
MSPIPTSPQFYGTTAAVGHSPIRLMSLLRLIFCSGPKVLVPSQISVKCAVAMVAMCAPALLFRTLLTLPALIFQSSQQHACFYFAKVPDKDPFQVRSQCSHPSGQAYVGRNHPTHYNPNNNAS